MTRFIHDQFAKDYLEELLSPYGEIQAPRRVAGEMRQIDVWFVPNQPPDITKLGLLAKLTQNTAIIEPYRNPAKSGEICDCLLKLLEVRGEYQREANRNNRNLEESNLPKLWILTPTASSNILDGFGATLKADWHQGIYFLPEKLRTSVVVIHQLPRTSETLWLRVLGRGKVQEQAIDELEALSPDDPLRLITLELFYQLQENLNINQPIEAEDRELIMRLRPLYQEKLAQAEQRGIQQGIQQEARRVIESLLRNRFGELDAEVTAIVEPLLALPPEEFTRLLLQLSREELIARFQPLN
ncbi:hypothetical protein [Cylindrospermum sp. FACHB-282]|uniref:hypothetical protein n=1 Tax=Cylindrospermum sp. FACHB-282 TaxID=2692794 RepID=UPI0016828073|nr:hypothetical protein [Cylindrospermum sp. FACHB-282]MBD2387067.1 hypothetical protein [Cylindrospermum sp. FACHB-282]